VLIQKHKINKGIKIKNKRNERDLTFKLDENKKKRHRTEQK
jgi:hypothetical protein